MRREISTASHRRRWRLLRLLLFFSGDRSFFLINRLWIIRSRLHRSREQQISSIDMRLLFYLFAATCSFVSVLASNQTTNFTLMINLPETGSLPRQIPYVRRTSRCRSSMIDSTFLRLEISPCEIQCAD